MQDPHFAIDWLEQHGDALYRYALLQCRDKEQAAELVQETLLAGMEAYGRFKQTSQMRSWLIGILKHKLFDHFRRQGKFASLPEDDDELAAFFDNSGHWQQSIAAMASPEGDLQQRQFSAVLETCLEKLPWKMRQVFIASEVLAEESEKICQDLSISTTNLWKLRQRSMLQLRACIQKHWSRS